MAQESIHQRQKRTRPPRVHISYDVETGGAIRKVEIPFVVGVLADLSGNPSEPLPAFKKRSFAEIDRYNFDKVLGAQKPRLTFRVDNKLANDDSKLGVELKFGKLADFEPQNVAKQVEPLRELIEQRNKLANLQSNLYGNDKLDALLQSVLSNTDELAKLKKEIEPSKES